MVKLEELSLDQKRTYSFLKSLLPIWEGAKRGIVVKTNGIRSISTNYERGNIVIYRKSGLVEGNILIGREANGGLGYIHAGVPESYVEEIVE